MPWQTFQMILSLNTALRPADYANPIGPSSIGGEKIAKALVALVTGKDGQGTGILAGDNRTISAAFRCLILSPYSLIPVLGFVLSSRHARANHPPLRHTARQRSRSCSWLERQGAGSALFRHHHHRRKVHQRIRQRQSGAIRILDYLVRFLRGRSFL